MLSALTVGCAYADEKPKDAIAVWTGISASSDSLYGYAGGLMAWNGDLDADGLLVRLGLGGGEYETDGHHSQTVEHYDADLMFGYRMRFGDMLVSLYSGPDIDSHDNDDHDADLSGTRLGGKAQFEVYAPLTDATYLSGFGNYSSAFGSFNVSAKAQYRIAEDWSAGPEFAMLGCGSFDQTRSGLAAAYNFKPGAELSVSAGYAWAMDDDRQGGVFGLINLYSRF